MSMSSKKILVIYHKNCLDGFGSAWTVWKKFKDKADYIPADHQSPPPKNIKGKDIYMVDFCYSEEVMENIKKKANKVIVIDHHISQKKAVKISDNYVYNQKNSGAVLTWKYFFPEKKVPKLLLYIEDKDIWKFSLKNTNELLAAVEMVGFDFKAWNKLAKDFEEDNKRNEYFKKGSHIIAFSEKNIESIASNAEQVIFEKKKCLSVNSPIFVSDIGHILATKAKGIGIIWCKKGNKLKISLRSNGKVDVAKIAAKHGGGGHKAAASFSIEVKGNTLKFPWKSSL